MKTLDEKLMDCVKAGLITFDDCSMLCQAVDYVQNHPMLIYPASDESKAYKVTYGEHMYNYIHGVRVNIS